MLQVVEEYKIESLGIGLAGLYISCKGEAQVIKHDGKTYLSTTFYVYTTEDYSTVHLSTISKTIESPENLVNHPCYLLYENLKTTDFSGCTFVNL